MRIQLTLQSTVTRLDGTLLQPFGLLPKFGQLLIERDHQHKRDHHDLDQPDPGEGNPARLPQSERPGQHQQQLRNGKNQIIDKEKSYGGGPANQDQLFLASQRIAHERAYPILDPYRQETDDIESQYNRQQRQQGDQHMLVPGLYIREKDYREKRKTGQPGKKANIHYPIPIMSHTIILLFSRS